MYEPILINLSMNANMIIATIYLKMKYDLKLSLKVTKSQPFRTLYVSAEI